MSEYTSNSNSDFEEFFDSTNNISAVFGKNLDVWDIDWDISKIKNIFKLRNVQYSLGDPGKMSSLKNHTFLGVSCKREFRTCQALTFARVFTNVETSDAYKHIFYEVFSTIEKDNRKEIKFSYLNSNSNGIGCIIADAHKDQAIGLYKFLHKKYPNGTSLSLFAAIKKAGEFDNRE
ncbi:8711_t:CDS:2 [Funneliformis geosporum]|uniref:8711_t:CDS:1 n=1 Tax=Funneliformis geosporum TaxID=1117311 RepID=A0A9W4WR99_9GLOM|nr:8711_t:CDS:2 [Funneliformis geosporum]